MTRSMPTSPAQVVESLRRITAEHPLDRKVLVASRPAIARELLEWLARAGGAWIGWEASSPRHLAWDLAGPGLSARGVSLSDGFDVQAMLDEAIDEACRKGRAGPFGRDVALYRDHLHRSLRALREAGVSAADLRHRAGTSGKLGALAAILEGYELRLASAARVDGAGVLAKALALLNAGAAPPHAPTDEAKAVRRDTRQPSQTARIYLLPGLSPFGLGGAFLRALLERAGAELVAADPVLRLAAPDPALWREAPEAASPLSRLHEDPAGGMRVRDVRLFAAATPTEELREVLRRAIADGVPWDQVEIVATDPDLYGAALDALARELSIPVTYGAGLDVGRTRVGRAIAEYLEWISGGFRDEVLRRMMAGGTLAPPEIEGVTGAALARALRRLRIGWDRERYLPAVERALERLGGAAGPSEEEEPDAFVLARARARRDLHALRELLSSLLQATPSLPGPGSRESFECSPASIAGGVLRLIGHVPAGDAAENATRQVLLQRLRRIEAVLLRERPWPEAIAAVQAHLRTRTSPAGEDARPSGWTPTGGSLHLSDLDAGGLAGRRCTFVVGLTLDATAGVAQDPLLSDTELTDLAPAPGGRATLPLSPQRLALKRHGLAALLARLRGEITLSYCAWDPTEGRAVAPAAELLQLYRHRYGNPARTYRQLERVLRRLACRVPGRVSADATDVWLAALAGSRHGTFRRGADAVAGLNALLVRGLRAREMRESDVVTEYDGKIGVAPELDPRRPDLVLSASRLETLGACPRRYFYRYVLGVAPVEDAEWDPQAWLDAAQRGSLLHAVFEATLRGARAADVAFGSPALLELAGTALQEELELAREEIPPPNEAVFAAEARELKADLGSFLRMLERSAPPWRELELDFGPEAGRPVIVPVSGGALSVRGRIDRLDDAPGGGLRVVDYKTGAARRYREQRPFDGGRRIQHVLYSTAAEQLFGLPVQAMEYHFPTRRGQNAVVPYAPARLTQGVRVLDGLVRIAAGGDFVGTDDPDDCSYCRFAPICRIRVDGFGKAAGGPAEWLKGRKPIPTEYDMLAALRTIDD